MRATSTPADIVVARARDLRRALQLEWLSMAWMAVEGSGALVTGLAAGSLVLIAFSVDSVIELISAGVLLWRLWAELRHSSISAEAAERRAGRIGGALLILLSAYILVGGVRSLAAHAGQQFSGVGLAVTAAAIPVMALLARGKRRLADRLQSHALRADAVESLTCGYLSVIVCVSLLAQLAVGAWWIGGVSALVIVPFLWREAREAWTGQDCCR
ncbi:MAG TPA: cation transporter [Vicinamibacterales bacterium]|jgi:divalent metal cation (Fe/Co/Zn/Cd) transporter